MPSLASARAVWTRALALFFVGTGERAFTNTRDSHRQGDARASNGGRGEGGGTDPRRPPQPPTLPSSSPRPPVDAVESFSGEIEARKRAVLVTETRARVIA